MLEFLANFDRQALQAGQHPSGKEVNNKKKTFDILVYGIEVEADLKEEYNHQKLCSEWFSPLSDPTNENRGAA